MANELYWFYDALAAGVILIAVYFGARRGFMRSVVLIALIVVSIIASWFISNIGAPVIYDRLLHKKIIAMLDDSSGKTDPLEIVSEAVSDGDYGVEMTDPEIEGVIGLGGDFFSNIASEIKNNGSGDSHDDIMTGIESSVTDKMLTALLGDAVSPATLEEVLTEVSDAESNIRSVVDVFLNGNRADTATAVEQMLVAPAVKMLLRGIIWVLSMFILIVVAKYIAGLFERVNEIPIIGSVNVLAGAALGLIEGAVILYLISQVVRFIIYLTGDSLMFLNSTTVAQTYVFKYIYSFDITSLF